MTNAATITGVLPRDLGNDVSDAIHKALSKGMAVDEACCVVVTVAADYARQEYGGRYLKDLAKVVREQRYKAPPQEHKHGEQL